MFSHIRLSALIAIFLVSAACLLKAENRVLAELRFVPTTSADKGAGVWVDGQYVGYVKELKGDKKVLLLPGKHDIVVRQAWYKNYVTEALLQPGQVHTITISLAKDVRTSPVPATGEVENLRHPSEGRSLRR